MISGKTGSAIENYEKSLQLNPRNTNGVKDAREATQRDRATIERRSGTG